MRLLAPSTLPIGLDVGATGVRAVQVARARGGARIIAAASVPRRAVGAPFDGAEAGRVAAVLARRGFRGEGVTVCAPGDRALCAVMELPPRSSGAPLEVIARQELARASRCEAGALELAWWELPGGARAAEGTHVMAVGCRHADAEPLVAAALSAGLDVAALDAPPTALARACAPLASPAPELTAIVSLGWTAAQLIMLAGPTLVYERTLGDSGLRLLHTAVANQLGADDELTRFLVRTAGCAQPAEGEAALEQAGEARSLVAAHADGVASEVRTGMSYAVRRFDAPLTRLVLAGGGAAVPGVPERLKERTGLDVRVARAGDLCPAAPGVAEEDLGPDMALALGLALHALDTKGGAA